MDTPNKDEICIPRDRLYQMIHEPEWRNEVSGRCVICGGHYEYEHNGDDWTIHHRDDCLYSKLAALMGESSIQTGKD